MQDFTCQTNLNLSMNTPRKNKQKIVIHTQRTKINRLQKALEKKMRTKQGKKERTLDEALGKLPENLAHFVRMQLKLHSKKGKGRRYSPQVKSIAVSLYRKWQGLQNSIEVIHSANKIITPSVHLKNASSCRNFPGCPEHNKEKVESMNEQEKLCTLCMDEISLKTNLFYDISKDRIVGLEDYGSGTRTNKVANSALVLLLRSISGKWKQPLGYALVNGGCLKEEMEEPMKGAIDKVEGIGLKVVVVMSDLGSNFQSLANHLGVTPERPWFIHNQKKYFLMFDPPHLIKCIRNNLMKYTFKSDQYTAKWQDIEEFYTKDKELPPN